MQAVHATWGKHDHVQELHLGTEVILEERGDESLHEQEANEVNLRVS